MTMATIRKGINTMTKTTMNKRNSEGSVLRFDGEMNTRHVANNVTSYDQMMKATTFLVVKHLEEHARIFASPQTIKRTNRTA